MLVVIAIIGLLASVVLLALSGARAKSRDAARIADVREIASAMELFFNDYNSYPTLAVTVSDGSKAPWGLTPTYIGVWPIAPTPVDGNCTTGGSGNNAFQFTPAGTNTATTYTLGFCLGGLGGICF